MKKLLAILSAMSLLIISCAFAFPAVAESNPSIRSKSISTFSNEKVKIEIIDGQIEGNHLYLSIKITNLSDKNKSITSLLREIDVLQEDKNSVYELSKDYSKTRKHDEESYKKMDAKLKPNGIIELTVVYEKKIEDDIVYIRNDDEDDEAFELIIKK
ncbi:hypothetical protein NHG25_08515 [Aerococcaceae bacterium NML191292]|nr:hypothetical protein [Aerococcaceae bacterium NML191292]